MNLLALLASLSPLVRRSRLDGVLADMAELSAECDRLEAWNGEYRDGIRKAEAELEEAVGLAGRLRADLARANADAAVLESENGRLSASLFAARRDKANAVELIRNAHRMLDVFVASDEGQMAAGTFEMGESMGLKPQ